MKQRSLVLLLVGGIVLLVTAATLYLKTAGWSGPPPDALRTLRPDDPQLLATGARLYAQTCAVCHGAKGEGQPNWRERGPDGLLPAPPHDPSGHTWHHPDAQLFAMTRDGIAKLIRDPSYRSAMPAYGGVLSDEEIVAVLSWIKAQWPPEIRRRHDEINAQYRQSQPH